MDWLSAVLSQKTFWIYYLRLFQDFEGDYVTACCQWFGVERARLETDILGNLYQLQNAEAESLSLHALSLPISSGGSLEILFQPYGPGEQFFLKTSEEMVPLAEVDVDDICQPCFPLRLLPRVAGRLAGELASAWGALLLYKLSYAAPEDDVEALANILRAAFPPGLFTAAEQAHIISSQQRGWRNQQRRFRPVRTIEHPAWQRLVGDALTGSDDDCIL